MFYVGGLDGRRAEEVSGTDFMQSSPDLLRLEAPEIIHQWNTYYLTLVNYTTIQNLTLLAKEWKTSIASASNRQAFPSLKYDLTTRTQI